jgi:hypothetical protein
MFYLAILDFSLVALAIVGFAFLGWCWSGFSERPSAGPDLEKIQNHTRTKEAPVISRRKRCA